MLLCQVYNHGLYFTRRGSEVRVLYRPPFDKCNSGFSLEGLILTWRVIGEASDIWLVENLPYINLVTDSFSYRVGI